MTDHDSIRSIRDFETLAEYLRDELDWPLDEDVDVEDLAFEYEPDELGLDKGYEVKVREIKQLRPASGNQPWGIFYVDFETKQLPVVVLRRALRALVPKKRASAASSHQATWEAEDLLFIAATGEAGNRGISFAHFEKNEGGQPRLKTVSWDEQETHFFYLEQNIARLRWPEDEDDTEAWRKNWASAFPTEHREVIRTSKELSVELAGLARKTRGLIREVYSYEAKDGSLHKLHESFRTVLIEDLDVDGFADMVAQTISYGLFSARATGDTVLGLAHLEAMVPNTNPFLKELFAEFVSMSGMGKHQIDFDELGVSELVVMLNEVNVEAVLQDFGKQTGGGSQDPVIYFYEDFLKDYDKDQKVKRGEFYTPKPVVSCIVRSVDRVLRDELGCPDGLADTSTMEWNGETWPKVMILDPATGTGTFLETVIEVIYETMTEKWRKEGKKQSEIHAAWNEYVPEHLLPRLHGFELMMAPYSVAHMKLGLKLKETGYEFDSGERLRMYLTNTLEEPKDYSGQLFAEFLAHEAEAANKVKRDTPITVIVGNPPYAGHSANYNEWINRLLRIELNGNADSYFRVDGKPLGERNPKYLLDDYVKFIRFSQWQLTRSGEGVLGFITNHGFLDNPTFRGMRQSLMQTFTDIALIDLHGNSNRKEKTPEGGKDENIFDIRQGVSIGIFLKKASGIGSTQIDHTDIWGNRTAKTEWLTGRSVDPADLKEITPRSPTYLFTPQDITLLTEYEQGWRITEAMPLSSTGVKTHRDHFVMDFDAHFLRERIADFRNLTVPDSIITKKYNLKDTRDWKLAQRRRLLASNEEWIKGFTQCLYRPFDFRYYFHDPDVVELPRNEVMQHLLAGPNLGLVCMRQVALDDQYSHFGVANIPVDNRAFFSNKGTMSLNPLYLYPKRDNLFNAGENRRKPNLSPAFIEDILKKLDLSFISGGKGDLEDTFGPEDVFHYAYAIFHSPTYRKRYAEFLKRDFPRLPLTNDLELFAELCNWGEELVSLHLMRAPYLDDSFTTFPKTGSNVMEKAKYDAEENRVYINKEKQYFDNVPEETWNFRVGGYQVLDKWLKDRKGRTLTPDDVKHYTKVVAALHETAQIMREIDKVIDNHGGWPLPGSVSGEGK